MSLRFFESTFKSVQTPVLVCRNQEGYPLVFANAKAQILLNPHLTVSNLDEEERDDFGGLSSLLRFRSTEESRDFFSLIRSTGMANRYRATVLSFEDRHIDIYLSGNQVETDEGDFLVLYLHEDERGRTWTERDVVDIMDRVFQIAYHSADMNEAINTILRLAGSFAHVSRCYIFEEISAEMTRNTYEWCNAGVEPAIQDLQHLRKDDYNYDAIVQSGVYITNDIRDLPENDFEILDAQGIKSLAILTMYHLEQPIGYIGFDDCAEYRQWSAFEIQVLQDIAGVITSLIVRRKAEDKAARTSDILQTVLDNIDNVVYVNYVDTYELAFVNKATADALGTPVDELIGKPCWQVLQCGFEEPCSFCPLRDMIGEDGEVLKKAHTWEFENTRLRKWYTVRDSIIPWMDGRQVHIETATEITDQKKHEEQLRYFASTDTMTGVYKREWGSQLMQNMLENHNFRRTPAVSLVFADLDGLKSTNDTFGHDVGDEMIITIVNTIRSSIRKSDLIIRWGGDEFLLILECPPAKANHIIEGVQEKLEKINREEARPYKLGFSYGVTEFVLNGTATIDQIIMEADQRMYENKMAKRDRPQRSQ